MMLSKFNDQYWGKRFVLHALHAEAGLKAYTQNEKEKRMEVTNQYTRSESTTANHIQ